LKVWDRKTGALVADLTGGHTGRIFCIGFDSKKVRSACLSRTALISCTRLDCIMWRRSSKFRIPEPGSADIDFFFGAEDMHMGLFEWDRYKLPTLSARSDSPVMFLVSVVHSWCSYLPEVARIR